MKPTKRHRLRLADPELSTGTGATRCAWRSRSPAPLGRSRRGPLRRSLTRAQRGHVCCRVAPEDRSSGAPTDPDMRISRIRLVTSWLRDPWCYPFALRWDACWTRCSRHRSPERLRDAVGPFPSLGRSGSYPSVHRYYGWLRLPLGHPTSLWSSLGSAVPAHLLRRCRRRWGLLRSWGTSGSTPPSS